jgi:two-component system phosphate regulon sensor histidine kinase PhoR
MNIPAALSSELWRLAGYGLLIGLIGALFGAALPTLLVAALGYGLWHLVNLMRLHHWLTSGRKFHPPEAGGIWGETCYQLYRLQQRHRRRKRDLRAMLLRYRESTAALPDATVVLGPRWECEWWNDAAERLLGLRQPQDVGQRVDNLVRYPDFSRYIESGDFSDRLMLPSPVNGEITLTLRIIPYAVGQNLLVARDVTQMENLEKMRREFVANVSHELRTPLTVFTGFLETFEDADLGEEWRRPLAQMREQSSRMRRLVDDLLLLARLESPSGGLPRDEVNVTKILEGIVEEARLLSGEMRHDIRLVADASLWLYGHEGELRSAFANLVTNAVQYTPRGDRIEVEWGADAAGAHCVVRDHGIGIPAQHIPRLTERFYRVDSGRSRERGGTGLGLAIVKHVLQRHGARLHIESTLGSGSSFSCDFPAAQLLRVTPPAGSAPEPALPAG